MVTQAAIEISIHIFGFIVYIPASRPDVSESGPGKADAECRRRQLARGLTMNSPETPCPSARLRVASGPRSRHRRNGLDLARDRLEPVVLLQKWQESVR